MRMFLIGALVFVLHQQYVAAQVTPDGIGLECPSIKDVSASSGVLVITDPRTALRITAVNPASIQQVRYEYMDVQTGQMRIEEPVLPAPPAITTHTLTNFMVGTTVVTVEITDGIERALCTFRAVRAGQAGIVCPNVASSSLSQISFPTPSLSNFPNNGANAVFTYRLTNLDVNPQVINTILASNVPFSQQTHVLSNMRAGTNMITVMAVDTTTNPQTSAACTFNFERTSILSIQCPNNVVGNVNCGSGTSFVSFSPATPLNVIGITSIVYSSNTNTGLVSFNTQNQNQVTASFPVGIWTVQTTVTDNGRPFGQNTASCTFTVQVAAGDSNPPQITCPANLNSQSQCGAATGSLQFLRPTATDNQGTPNVQCSAGNVQLIQQANNQFTANFPAGVTTITCTATDACGLTSNCQFTASVSGGDNTPPQIACPANLISQSQCGAASGSLQFLRPTATDSSGVPNVQCSAGNVQLIQQANNQFSGNFPNGVTTITCTATDSCNLSSQCTFTASVFGGDSSPPQITCPADLNSQSQFGAATGSLQFLTPLATDNQGTPLVQCSAGNVQLIQQANNQFTANFPAGVTTITCTATDACGLTSICQFTASVSGALPGMSTPLVMSTQSVMSTQKQITKSGITTATTTIQELSTDYNNGVIIGLSVGIAAVLIIFVSIIIIYNRRKSSIIRQDNGHLSKSAQPQDHVTYQNATVGNATKSEIYLDLDKTTQPESVYQGLTNPEALKSNDNSLTNNTNNKDKKTVGTTNKSEIYTDLDKASKQPESVYQGLTNPETLNSDDYEIPDDNSLLNNTNDKNNKMDQDLVYQEISETVEEPSEYEYEDNLNVCNASVNF